MWWVMSVVIACVGCGRLDFDIVRASDAVATTRMPIHRYRFAGNLDDDFGGPSLVAVGTTAFVAGGASFTTGSGFTVSGATPASLYTIDTIVALDDLAGWRKLIDFADYSQDSGFYVYRAAIQQVIVSEMDFLTSVASLTPGTSFRVTLVRDAGGIATVYLDGVPLAGVRSDMPVPPVSANGAFTFDDSVVMSAAFSSPFASWFVDDTVTNGTEASGGVVREITIWDIALDATQVASET